MTRLWIDHGSNISPSQNHASAHRNLALNRTQCGTYIRERGDSGNRPLNRFALKFACCKASVINNDRCAAALKVNVGKVCELHHLINLRCTQRVKLRVSVERCTRDGAVEQSSVKEAVAQLSRNPRADATLPA